MSVVIKGYNKPKDCYSCRFNDNDCLCSITKGTIDRDDYTCSALCPIEQLPKAESEECVLSREEAIARIENHKIVHKMNEPRAIYISEALDMAIEALKQETRWIPAIPIPDNATNGDILKALFPCLEKCEYEELYIHGIALAGNDDRVTWFANEWWNAPYKRGETE